VLSEILHAFGVAEFGLSTVAMLGAAALYALSRDRTHMLKSVDYSVLVFFAAMFVVTSAMWSSGAIAVITGWLPEPNPADRAQSIGVISAASLSLSQVLSNVHFVALYDYVMIGNGFGSHHFSQWLMLAAASTVAGNLTVLGAASNIIVIEAAEARGIRAFGFSSLPRLAE
jgi:Na+/H+ antiporter NhaD/arsenite permease-like protein